MLTTAYAQGGFPEEALDAWTSISENYYLPNRVKTLAVVAVAQAREGVDASEVIAKVQELTGLIEPTEPVFDVPGAEKAEIYADLARASFLSGDDPQPMFNTALRHALEETSNLRTNAYIEIAKAQLDVGIDARNTLTLARDWASGIVKPDEPDGSWGSAIQIIDWEYVFRAQLEGQYFDEARETLKLFERYPEEEVAAYTAGLLAALGRAQMLSIYNTHV